MVNLKKLRGQKVWIKMFFFTFCDAPLRSPLSHNALFPVGSSSTSSLVFGGRRTWQKNVNEKLTISPCVVHIPILPFVYNGVFCYNVIYKTCKHNPVTILTMLMFPNLSAEAMVSQSSRQAVVTQRGYVSSAKMMSWFSLRR